jgi:RNA polymerase sigma-70 factor (sigma-E family)
MVGVREVRVDEPEGFAEFVRASSRELLRTGWLLTGNWASAQDLVQTALAKTWPRWDVVDAAAASAYVRRVMVTTFLAWRRRRWSGELPVEELPDGDPSGVDAFAQADLAVSVRAALLDLPPRQRAVIVLRYFLDLTEVATAAALDCSVPTVKTHSARALATLRATPGLADEPGGLDTTKEAKR